MTGAFSFCPLSPKSQIPTSRIARGSIEETKYHLRLAKDLGYLDEDMFEKFKNGYETVGKMLNGLINSIKEKQGEE